MPAITPRAAAVVAEPAIAVPWAEIGAVREAGRLDAFAAIVDAVVEADEQFRLLRICGGGVALGGHVPDDEVGLLAELDAARQVRIVGNDREGLAGRRGQLRLEARDIGAEGGGASGKRDEQECHSRQPDATG